jgi:hypothetical protein
VTGTLPTISLQMQPVAVPAAHAGWFLGFGYSQKPMVLYATRGQMVRRGGAHRVAITHYAGPLPEAMNA